MKTRYSLIALIFLIASIQSFGQANRLTQAGGSQQTSFVKSRILHVDPNGVNSSAEKGNEQKPFRDPWNAKKVAEKGDVIYINPGTYSWSNLGGGGTFEAANATEASLWKDSVIYYAEPGVTFVNETDTAKYRLFTPDTTSAKTTLIFKGHASFINNDYLIVASSGTFGARFNVDFQFNEMDITGDYANPILCQPCENVSFIGKKVIRDSPRETFWFRGSLRTNDTFPSDIYVGIEHLQIDSSGFSTGSGDLGILNANRQFINSRIVYDIGNMDVVSSGWKSIYSVGGWVADKSNTSVTVKIGNLRYRDIYLMNGTYDSYDLSGTQNHYLGNNPAPNYALNTLFPIYWDNNPTVANNKYHFEIGNFVGDASVTGFMNVDPDVSPRNMADINIRVGNAYSPNGHPLVGAGQARLGFDTVMTINVHFDHAHVDNGPVGFFENDNGAINVSGELSNNGNFPVLWFEGGTADQNYRFNNVSLYNEDGYGPLIDANGNPVTIIANNLSGRGSALTSDEITIIEDRPIVQPRAPGFAYVSVNGNDDYGVIGDSRNPFRSISAALAAQDSTKRIYLMPGRHYVRDTLHYNMAHDSIFIHGPEAVIIQDDSTKGQFFMELHTGPAEFPDYLEVKVMGMEDQRSVLGTYWFYMGYDYECNSHIELGYYKGKDGSRQAGYSEFLLHGGTSYQKIGTITNPPSRWARTHNEGGDDVSYLEIGSVIFDYEETDSFVFDGLHRYSLEDTGGVWTTKIGSIKGQRISALDNQGPILINSSGPVYGAAIDVEIGNVSDDFDQQYVDLDASSMFGDELFNWRVRSLAVEGSFYNSNIHVSVKNWNGKTFIVGGSSGLDLDSTYYHIDLGTITSETRQVEFYSMNVINGSTLHVHCDNCTSLNDRNIMIRDGVVDASSKVIFSGNWTTERDSTPNIYFGNTGGIHLRNIQLNNDGQVAQVVPDATGNRDVYYYNISSQDSLWQHPNINWYEYDDFDVASSGGGGGDNGLFGAVNQGEVFGVDSVRIASSGLLRFHNETPNGLYTDIYPGGMFAKVVDGTGDVNGLNYSTYYGGDIRMYHDRNSNLSNHVIEFFRRGWTGTTYDITPNGAKMGGIWFTRGTGVGTQDRHWMEFNAIITDNSTGEGYFNWDIEDGDANKNGELLRLTNETSAPSPYRFNRLGAGVFGTGTETLKIIGTDASGYALNNGANYSLNSTAAAAGISFNTNGSGSGSAFIANKSGIAAISTEELGNFSFGYNGAPIGGLFGQATSFTGDVNLQLRVGPSSSTDVALEINEDKTVVLPGYAGGAKDDTPTKAFGLNGSNELVTFAVPSGGGGNGIFQDVARDTMRSGSFHAVMPENADFTIGNTNNSIGSQFFMSNNYGDPYLFQRYRTATDRIDMLINPTYSERIWVGAYAYLEEYIENTSGSSYWQQQGVLQSGPTNTLFTGQRMDFEDRRYNIGSEVTNGNWLGSVVDAGNGIYSLGTFTGLNQAINYPFINIDGTSTTGDRISFYDSSYVFPNAVPPSDGTNYNIVWNNGVPSFAAAGGGGGDGNGLLSASNLNGTISADTVNLSTDDLHIRGDSAWFELLDHGRLRVAGSAKKAQYIMGSMGSDFQLIHASQNTTSLPVVELFREGHDETNIGNAGRTTTPDNVALGAHWFTSKNGGSLNRGVVRTEAGMGSLANDEYRLRTLINGTEYLNIGNFGIGTNDGLTSRKTHYFEDSIRLTGASNRIFSDGLLQIDAIASGGSSQGRILMSTNTAIPLQIRDIDPSNAANYSGLAFSFDSQSNFTAAPGTGFLFSIPGANLDIDADTVKLVDLPNQPPVRENNFVVTSDQNGHLEPSIKGLYSDTTLSVTNNNILSFGTIFADHETTIIESIVNTSASTDNTLLLGTATTAMLGHKIVVTNSDTDTDPASDDYDTALSGTSPISLNGTTVSGYMMARGETVTLTIANIGGSPAFVISGSSIRSGNIHTITAASPTLQLERGIVLQFDAGTQGLTTNTLATSDLEHGDELQIVIIGANGGNDATLDLDFGNIVWDNLSGDATETFNQARHSFTAVWDDVNELLILNGN